MEGSGIFAQQLGAVRDKSNQNRVHVCVGVCVYTRVCTHVCLRCVCMREFSCSCMCVCARSFVVVDVI